MNGLVAHLMLLTACLIALAPSHGAAQTLPSTATPAPHIESLRKAYREDAEKCTFYADAQHQQALTMVQQPIMRWFNDDDWSGDVFVWTHEGRPVVIGCILSGPAGDSN